MKQNRRKSQIYVSVSVQNSVYPHWLFLCFSIKYFISPSIYKNKAKCLLDAMCYYNKGFINQKEWSMYATANEKAWIFVSLWACLWVTEMG